MAFSTKYGAALGDHARGRTASSMGSTWLAAYVGAIDLSSTAHAVTNEASYSGYARVACGTGGSSIFSAASTSTGTATNPGTVNFPANGSGSSVTITGVAIVDSASGAGTVRMGWSLVSPQTYAPGEQPNFTASMLSDTFSNLNA